MLSTPQPPRRRAILGVLLALSFALAALVPPIQAQSGQDHDGPLADLVVDQLTLSATPAPGETVQVTARVTNVGPGDAHGWFYVLIRSEDYSLYEGDGHYQLPAGESTTFTINWTAPERLHVLTATADAFGWIDETNETNNQAERSVIVGDPKPDLKGWGPYLVPSEVLFEDQLDAPWRSTVREGDAMTLFAEFDNIGTAPLEALRVQTFVDDVLYDDRVIQAEGHWDFDDFPVLVNWTAVLGTHSFRLVADPLGEVDEKNETNNVLELEVTVLSQDEPVPDLAIVALDVPADPEVGDRLQITAVIENTGTVASPAFDSFLHVANLGEAAMRVPGLEPGAQAELSLVGMLPIDGWYHGGAIYWAAVVDPFITGDEDTGEFRIGGEVPEDNETNNYFVGHLPVRAPDLEIGAVRFPDGPFMPGDVATVEVDVVNNGTAPAYGAFSVRFDGHGNEDQSVYGLDIGETATLRFQTVIHGFEHGHHGLVRLDVGGVVGELDEFDNRLIVESALSSAIHATIEVSDDDPWVGQVVTVTARFQNTGDIWHSHVHAVFRLDGDYLHSATYEGVDEEGTITATLHWTALQEGLSPDLGERTFTVEMWPFYRDDDHSDNEASATVTVKATPLPLPV